MGDKVTAKETMIKAGVPVVPGSDGLVKSVKAGIEVSKEIGYPVIIKATAGGGGKGMRIVWSEDDFEAQWNMARNEAKASFGNDGIYIEKFIEEPRHIEIQIIGDQHGNVVHLSERDCSIQRRHQKLVEECPSPFMTDELRDQMGEAAILAGKSINYEGVGTVEFLVDKYRKFYFMEMNTRIQVEHPVTEEVMGCDLIKAQIEVAAGQPLSSHVLNATPRGHSIECRINAEDPYNNFAPCPGKIDLWYAPGGKGVRVDTHVYAGYAVPPYYDSMIAKLIVTASSREGAIARMKRSLSEFMIEGIKTTIPFQQEIIDHEDFKGGGYDIGWVGRYIEETQK